MKKVRSLIITILIAAAAGAPVLWRQPVYAQGRVVEREVTRYTVRPGDTLSSIARASGLTLGELLNLNPDVDPRFLRLGQVIYLPARSPQMADLQIELDSYRGRVDEDVSITARGFPPRTRLRVLVGDGPYRLETVDSVRADRRGRVDLEIELPDWARPGSLVYFGLQSRDGQYRVLARPYKVTGKQAQPDRNRIEVSGTLTRQGVECPTMRGDDGRIYSLVGGTRGFRPGDRVMVEGRIAEMSFCQQGTALDVRRISPID